MSEKKKAQREPNAIVRATVFARDGHCVALDLWPGHQCFGCPTVHHLRKAGQGGAYVESNLVQMCAGGNDAIEDAVGEERVMLKRVGLIW